MKSKSPWHGREYKVTTWDIELQKFTPQKGVAPFRKNFASLLRALRKLGTMGYAWGDPSVAVDRVDKHAARDWQKRMARA